MSELSQGLTQLQSFLAQLEELSLEQPTQTLDQVLEALELAASFQMYESEASSLLLQICANLMERVKENELSEAERESVAVEMRTVGYAEEEIRDLLWADADLD
jgi:hypothetical protein